ncbi:protein-tyrosine phosphatase-like protein [Podospora australis]|uniref:protein-tyrosine-phosphatase n=1 Tax=Podospora australis TaxID=1536484 RepID=A0AAN7AE71_9PEZI|nr:protein-tyrosine phosphatase-like protein [Podospora australis]
MPHSSTPGNLSDHWHLGDEIKAHQFPSKQRHRASITQIEDYLYIGDHASSVSIPTLMKHGITAMVSLAHSRSPEWSRPANRKLIPASQHLFVKCDDSPQQDILGKLNEICDFIDAHTGLPTVDEVLEQIGLTDVDERVGEEVSTPRKVLVHCSMGVSRSGAVVVAYLMRKYPKKGLKKVLREVRRKRRAVDPSANFMEQLRVWQEIGYEAWEEGEGGKKVPVEGYRTFLERRALSQTPRSWTEDEISGLRQCSSSFF